jgi:hypothetical protein
VPLCEGGLDSITGISFQARFVPDAGYGEFPNTTASKAILLDASQMEVMDSFTPFGGHATWGLVSRSFNPVSGSYLKINLQAMGSWEGTVYIDDVSFSRSDSEVEQTCSSWNFDDGSFGGWTSSNVTLATSSPGYGGSGYALSWHHVYTNEGSSGMSMVVPLCEGGVDSITGISFQARFVPDAGYGEFPNTTASKAILLDASQMEVMDSFTPFGGHATWGLVSRSFNAVSGSYLKINLQAMGSWQGTVYIDNVSFSRSETIPAMTLTPTPLSFGSVVVGAVAASAVTVSNQSSVAALLPTATISGTNASEFSRNGPVPNECTTQLDAGQSCLIGIEFAPISLGAKTATFTLGSSTVSLTGNGASATPTPIYQINCGSSRSASPYTSDQYASGGIQRTVRNSITIGGIADPAPMAVYQSERYGNSTYTLPDLTAGSQYTVRLHFAELYQTAAGRRVFNVAINGTAVLSNFDIYAVAGARYKAVLREFTATANASGQIVIQFVTVTDNATIEGIEIIR